MSPTFANSWMLLMLVLGAGMVLAGYLAYRDGVGRQPPSEPLESHPADLQVARGSVPGVLWALFVGMGLALVGYVLYVWLAAPNI